MKRIIFYIVLVALTVAAAIILGALSVSEWNKASAAEKSTVINEAGGYTTTQHAGD